MQVVRGVLKEYDWGAVDGLARWSGVTTGAPQAELWFGVHPAGPARVVAGPDAGTTLDRLPDFAGIPMVKLLAASTPLSLQVHPDAQHAVRGWQAQQSLPADQRRYADQAEKREMLVALTAFDVHAGWRDADAAAGVLERALAPAPVVEAVRAGDHAAAIRLILGLDSHSCGEVERRLVAAATAAGWSQHAVSALARVAATYPADPGVLITVLLDHALLAPGEGIAVPAGVVHSYVVGLAVEVMTSSDNVLRLGLTSKAVAVDDALSAIRDDHAPVALGGFAGEVLDPAGMPFSLVLADHPVRADTGDYRLVLALHGSTTVAVDGATAVLEEGQAAVLHPAEAAAHIQPEGTAVVVTGSA